MPEMTELSKAIEALAAARQEVQRLEELVKRLYAEEAAQESKRSDSACAETSPSAASEYEEAGEELVNKEESVQNRNGVEDDGRGSSDGADSRQQNSNPSWYKKDRSKLPEKKWRR